MATQAAIATSEAAPAGKRAQGRGLLWLGVALAFLSVPAFIVQTSLKFLVVPWYAPVMATIGALLVLWSLTLRRTITRVAALLLVGAFAAFQWYFVVSLAKLPEYAGPVQAGQQLPEFRTTLANGGLWTDEDLRDGTRRVIVFFRGRW